jgi:tetratricopeptide (TPR) repeat protein
MGDALGHFASDVSFQFSLIQRLFLACYALMAYVFKLLIPGQLAIIHPFPSLDAGHLPILYYLSPIGMCLLFLGLFLLVKKTSQPLTILWGSLFFLVHISLVLHIIPTGGVSLLAERYTYLASVGLFVVVSWCSVSLFNRMSSIQGIRVLMLLVLMLYAGFLAVITYQRNRVWKNSLTLWNDQLRKYPTCFIAYNNRGTAKEQYGDHQGALDDFTQALTLHPHYATAYYNRGRLQDLLGNHQMAIADFDVVLALIPDHIQVLNDRGIAKSLLGDYAGAFEDLNAALSHDENFAEAYLNRGNIHIKWGNDTQALADLSHAIHLDSGLTQAYYNRAILYTKHQICDQATRDIEYLQMASVQLSNEFLRFFNMNCKTRN